MMSTLHSNRIRKELADAGMSAYGLRKTESRYLPKIIHEEEHIGGVVYGRYINGLAMLVATDKRIIFLDRKPLFTTNEELTYDVVSGFAINLNGIVSSITLHTRVKDFTLRYVNRTCANRFKKYLEQRRLEGIGAVNRSIKSNSKSFPLLTGEAITFLRSKDIAVLSTSSKTGAVHGAVVYYVVDEQHRIYILTKAETTKARNVIAHDQVALTIFDADDAQTLQIEGSAVIETDEKVKRYVFDKIIKPHKYNSGYKLPPVAWVEAGMFVIVTVTPQSATYSDFSNS